MFFFLHTVLIVLLSVKFCVHFVSISVFFFSLLYFPVKFLFFNILHLFACFVCIGTYLIGKGDDDFLWLRVLGCVCVRVFLFSIMPI